MTGSINDLDEFKNLAYSRIVSDEYDYLASFRLPTRRVSTAVYTNKGLRELLSYVSMKYNEASANLDSLLNRCATEHGMKKDNIAKLLSTLDVDYAMSNKRVDYDGKPLASTFGNYIKIQTPINSIVAATRGMIKSIDNSIAYTRNAVAVAKQSEKFNPVTIETMVKEGTNFETSELNGSLRLDDKFTGKDVFSADNMSLAVRKLMSFKSAVLNAFNKNFGVGTAYESLNLASFLAD